jgi:hypothetical protein
MRKAELLMAVVLAVFSAYLMWKSAELPIGWQPRRGPGGGAFPFWLSLGMLISSGVIFYRGWRGITEQGRSEEPFMDLHTLRLVAISVAAIFGMLLVTTYLGAYVAIPLFMIFYMWYFGRHRWAVMLPIALISPVALFFFFEIGMKIFLPKGATETWFYPLYAMFL